MSIPCPESGRVVGGVISSMKKGVYVALKQRRGGRSVQWSRSKCEQV